MPAYDHAYLRLSDERQWLPGSESTLFGHLYRSRVWAAIAAADHLRRNSRIVDLGCAQGNIARQLAAMGFLVTAVESNPDYLEYARLKDADGRVTWVCSDIRAYAPAEKFDAAILTEVIEHTGKPHELIEAAARLLRPNGLLILSTPNGDRIRQELPTFSSWLASPDTCVDAVFGPAGEHHQFLFTRKELRALLSERFSNFRFRPISSVLQNMITAPLLKYRFGRAFLDAAERILLATPFQRWLSNEWLVSAHRVA